ncbi:hypothetical protein FOCC_FOCC002896 [Frankliniella occidentalis]|nr:hypothetical protein FOCC_FOCC002896 [Frankliniella occidentalis]
MNPEVVVHFVLRRAFLKIREKQAQMQQPRPRQLQQQRRQQRSCSSWALQHLVSLHWGPTAVAVLYLERICGEVDVEVGFVVAVGRLAVEVVAAGFDVVLRSGVCWKLHYLHHLYQQRLGREYHET